MSAMPRVRGFSASRYQANYVSSLHAFLLCSATSGLNAPYQKKPIAGFPGASNKGEGFMPA